MGFTNGSDEEKEDLRSRGPRVDWSAHFEACGLHPEKTLLAAWKHAADNYARNLANAKTNSENRKQNAEDDGNRPVDLRTDYPVGYPEVIRHMEEESGLTLPIKLYGKVEIDLRERVEGWITQTMQKFKKKTGRSIRTVGGKGRPVESREKFDELVDEFSSVFE